MKEPENYEIKKWLCENRVISIKFKVEQYSNERWSYYWILGAEDGDEIGILDSVGLKLVDLCCKYGRVFHVKKEVRKEVEEYERFAKENQKELEEYKRLKAKFGDL